MESILNCELQPVAKTSPLLHSPTFPIPGSSETTVSNKESESQELEDLQSSVDTVVEQPAPEEVEVQKEEEKEKEKEEEVQEEMVVDSKVVEENQQQPVLYYTLDDEEMELQADTVTAGNDEEVDSEDLVTPFVNPSSGYNSFISAIGRLLKFTLIVELN